MWCLLMKRKLDIPLIITVFLICIYGIVMIYYASSVWAEYKFNDKFHYVLMQSIFFIIGIISVATLFLIILRSIKISVKVSDNFAKFLTFGIIFQLSFQTLLNLAVVVGLVPVTGVTLPFFSYGGSSLIITLISIGIILNISRYREN